MNRFEAKAGFSVAADYYGLDADTGEDASGVATPGGCARFLAQVDENVQSRRRLALV